jgi:hypothetical protein
MPRRVFAAGLLLSLPSRHARGWRSATRRIRTTKRALWRSTAAFSLRRRAALSSGSRGLPLGRRRSARPSASSWQGAVLPPGGAPTPPGSLLARQTRGRRTGRRPGIARCRPPRVDAVSPAPFPGSSRLATPREAPLSGRGGTDIVLVGINVKRCKTHVHVDDRVDECAG